MTEALKPSELSGLRWRSLDYQNTLPLTFCVPIKVGFSHRPILKMSLTRPVNHVRYGPKKCDEVHGKSKYEC